MVDFIKSGQLLWDEWLNDPRNAKFKALHDSTPKSAQLKLKEHMFQPFKLMKEIAQDHERWDIVSLLFFSTKKEMVIILTNHFKNIYLFV